MYGWNEEIVVDAPASRFRHGDSVGSTSVADSAGGAAGQVRGSLVFGQPSLVPSETDGAGLYNGIDSYALIADRPGVKVTGNGRIEFLISATRYTESRGLRGCIYDGGAREPIILWAPSLDGRLLVRVNSVGDICTSLTTIPLNTPTHVAVDFILSGGTVTARITINTSDVTGTVTAQTVTSNALSKCIGAADQGAGNFFAGTIDELAIYNASTPTQQRARAHFRAAFGIARTAARRLTHLDQNFAVASRSSLRVLKPNGAKTNDLVCVGIDTNSTSITPSHREFRIPEGAVVPNTTASRNHQLSFMWHRIAAGDPSSWEISLGESPTTCEAIAFIVRGAPTTAEPIGVVLGAALTSAGTQVPFAGPTSTGRGLMITMWSRFNSSGFPNQPDYWFYGSGLSGGVARIGTFERMILGAYKFPYMTNFTSSASDAWTTLQIVIKDGESQNTFINPAIGLDGVNSPNDAGNRGWEDGYTPALSIGANFIRTDFGPGKSWADSDAEFADAAARRMRVLPIIWSKQQISTINRATFTQYVADFVARYGPGGTFWANRRDGYLAPEYNELFNEPYGWWFVEEVVEPVAYAELIIESVRAGRASNPRSKYLIAGIDRYWTRRTGGSWANWFSPMFSAFPSLGEYVDGVTVHLYGTHPLDLSWFGNYDEWGGIIDTIVPELYARGLDIGGRVKIWATEIGFNTTSNTGSPDFGVSQADQASQIMDAMRLFFGRWQDVMGGVFVYRYRDGVADERETRWGISNNNNTDKPAKLALAATIPQLVTIASVYSFVEQWVPGLLHVYDGTTWQPTQGLVVA